MDHELGDGEGFSVESVEWPPNHGDFSPISDIGAPIYDHADM